MHYFELSTDFNSKELEFIAVVLIQKYCNKTISNDNIIENYKPYLNEFFFNNDTVLEYPINIYDINNNTIQSYNNSNSIYQNSITSARLVKEYKLCQADIDLVQIGCNFHLNNGNIYTWRVTMVGPSNTPYYGGLFEILIFFPKD